MPTILGDMVFCWEGVEPWRNKAEKFVGEFAKEFADNSPKIRQNQIKNPPQDRSAEPQDQIIPWAILQDKWPLS